MSASINDAIARNVLSGWDGDDRLSATAAAGTDEGDARAINSLDGGAGHDLLTASATAYSNFDGVALASNSLIGANGDDRLTAEAIATSDHGVGEPTTATNVLDGGTGNDVLVASGEAEVIQIDDPSSASVLNRLLGGDGDDLLTATAITNGEASNVLDGGAGHDRLSATASARGPGASASNDLSGGEGDDVLTATTTEFGDTNVLSGGEGDDRLTATGWTNILDGGAGDDVLLVTGALPFVEGGPSELFGGEGNDVLTVFRGGAGGGDFDNSGLLDGGAGSDVLRGGPGDDTLIIDADDLIGPGTTVSGGSERSEPDARFGPFDALVVDFDLDLTAVGNEKVANIESVDLTSGASNSLTLNADDVLAATDAGNTLVVEGDSAADTGSAPDAANLVGAWTVDGVSDGFTDYVLGGATVSIEADVAVAIA
jgi:Ca2+-binding RTX toxin-like protein